MKDTIVSWFSSKPTGSRTCIENWRKEDYENAVWQELKEKHRPIMYDGPEFSDQRLVANIVIKNAWQYLVNDFNQLYEAKISRENELISEKYKLDDRIKSLDEKLNKEKSSRVLTKKKVDREWGLKLQAEKNGRKTDLLEATERHQLELSMIQSGHQQEISNMQNDIIARERAHATEKANLIQTHEHENLALRRSFDTAMMEQTNDYTAAIERRDEEKAQLMERFRATMAQRDAEKAQMLEQFKAAIDRLGEEARSNEARLIAEFEKTQESLTVELHELNTALLARDDDAYLPPILNGADLRKEPDEHLKAKFLELGQIVDDLVNIPWRDDQTVWTEQALHNLGVDQNQRLLRKRILLDSVWTILQKHLYCSPFRLFGKEGKHLEEQWNGHCGKDTNYDNGYYVWPKPGVETERWRFFTVKECRQALLKPASEYDPRARLRKGFRESFENVVSELESTLSDVVVWDEAYSEVIKQLAKRFSNVWLEFGMHRCRIVIFLEGSQLQSVEEKVQEAEQGSLELVLAPGLGRYGDFRGAGLDQFAIIGGCTGQAIKLPS